MGYWRNEYDWCFRKNIEGKQYTIPWHVDDMNIFHVVSNILSSIIAVIGEEHGKISRMTITRGKIKKHPGMTINYSLTVKMILSMVCYIGNIIYGTP